MSRVEIAAKFECVENTDFVVPVVWPCFEIGEKSKEGLPITVAECYSRRQGRIAFHPTNTGSRQLPFQSQALLNPTDRISNQVSNNEPMKTTKESSKNEGSQVDSLMPVVPQVDPRIGQAGKETDLSFDLEGQRNGRSINDKEQKIDEYHLALGIDMAIEKRQERDKRMDHEQSCAQDQAISHAAIRNRAPFLLWHFDTGQVLAPGLTESR